MFRREGSSVVVKGPPSPEASCPGRLRAPRPPHTGCAERWLPRPRALAAGRSGPGCPRVFPVLVAERGQQSLRGPRLPPADSLCRESFVVLGAVRR